MIYLASPYSDSNHEVMESRFEAVCLKAGELMNQGLVVYSPIVHCHPIAVRIGLPRTWEYWKNFDYEMLKGAKRFVILRLPGWENSKGIQGEREIAESLGLKVEFIDV